MNSPNRLLSMGVYPLLIAAKTGGVVVDQIYARALQVQAPDLYSSVSSEAADALLLLMVPLMLAGAWSFWVAGGRARLLVVMSLLVLSLNLVIPLVASLTPGGMASLDQSGPLLRLAVQVGALLFAAVAVREATR